MRPLSQTSNAQTTEVDKGQTVNRAQELHIRAKSQINKEMRSELLGEGENNAANNISPLIQCTCKLVYLIFIFVDFCKDHAHYWLTFLDTLQRFS